MNDRLRYVDLPVALRGSPGALGRFRRRRVVIDPWVLFGFLAAALSVVLAIGWLRVLIGRMGPD